MMAHKLRREEEDTEGRGGSNVVHHATSYKHRVQLLSDELIEDLSGRLSSDWYKLGIELSIDMKTIDKLYNRGRVHADRWPFRLLQEWRKRRHHIPLKEQVIELAQGLEKIHRGDLVYILRRATGEHQSAEISDSLLMQLAEGVNQEWYTLGIHLDISSDKLDTIKMEEFPDSRLDPGADMLRVFREQYSGVDMVQDLQQALRGIRRLDLARYIDEKLSVTQWEPVFTPLHGSPKPRKATASSARYPCSDTLRLQSTQSQPSSDVPTLRGNAQREYSTSLVSQQCKDDQDLLLSQSSVSTYTTQSSSSYQSSVSSHKSHILPSSVDSSMMAGQSSTSTIVTSGSVYSKEKK